jgi:hypothetical protein
MQYFPYLIDDNETKAKVIKQFTWHQKVNKHQIQILNLGLCDKIIFHFQNKELS